MTVKEEKWLDIGIRPWEELQTIHVLEEGSQQLAADRSVLGVCNNTRHFFSLKETGRSKWIVFAFPCIFFNVILICFLANDISKDVNACDGMGLDGFLSHYQSTHNGFPCGCSEAQHCKMVCVCGCSFFGNSASWDFFFWPPTAPSPSWLVSPPTSTKKITISGLVSRYMLSSQKPCVLLFHCLPCQPRLAHLTCR